jgi:hypothetical protein
MVDKQDNGASVDAPAKSRHRSPNYPSFGLRAAVEKIQSLYKAGGLAPLMKITALKQMGLNKDDANAARHVAALKSFGLIEELGNDRLKLTQRGVDIVARQEGEPQRSAALRAAVNGPQVYRALLTEYAASGIPPDAALKSELIAVKRFNPNVVDDFIKDFRDTLDFSGLSDFSVLELPKEDVEGSGNGVNGKVYTPKIGDYVQWEPNGILQFREPKRVSGISADGAFAFVDGSSTGLLVGELTLQAKPASAPERIVLPLPEKQAMRQDVFSLAEGTVTIQWPTPLSADSIQDVKEWLKIVERKITRSTITEPADEIVSKEK